MEKAPVVPKPKRSHLLIIKCDNAPCPLTPLKIRDSLNRAIGSTTILSAQLAQPRYKTCDVLLTLMSHLLVAKLDSKVGLHIGLIPGARSLLLDNSLKQMIVHRIPTSIELASIQKELTTFNSVLVLASALKWLIIPDQRRRKKASSVVISLSGTRTQ